jgi:hypothetical protein
MAGGCASQWISKSTATAVTAPDPSSVNSRTEKDPAVVLQPVLPRPTATPF